MKNPGHQRSDCHTEPLMVVNLALTSKKKHVQFRIYSSLETQRPTAQMHRSSANQNLCVPRFIRNCNVPGEF